MARHQPPTDMQEALGEIAAKELDRGNDHADIDSGIRAERGDTITAEEQEALDAFMLQQYTNALPVIPPIPDYHVCWVSTTNPRDTPQMRQRLGYSFVRPTDFAGATSLTFSSMTSGVQGEVIAIAEMVAMKLPKRLYQLFMKEAHHDAPMREQMKLAEVADSIREQAREMGANIEMGDGTALLRRNRPAPDFTKLD